MSLASLAELRKKTEELVNKPGLTEAQKVFVRELTNEFCKMLAARQIRLQTAAVFHQSGMTICNSLAAIRPYLAASFSGICHVPSEPTEGTAGQGTPSISCASRIRHTSASTTGQFAAATGPTFSTIASYSVVSLIIEP